MRVVVTGGGGFIGSHVTEAFLERGDDVLIVDDFSSGSRENLAATAALAELDIADSERLHAALSDFGAELICHLAAQSSVTVSVTDPERDFASNVRGTYNICRAATELRAPIVFASTGGALYGEDAPLPTPETYVPQPLAPYGASKLAGEAYVATRARFDGLPHVVLRLGNVYGPRQSPYGEAGVVAIFSERLLTGEELTVFGHGKPTRDYVHVSDIARGFVLAAGRGAAGTFNLGWSQEVSVQELLRVLEAAAGTRAKPRVEELRAGELTRSALDSRHANEELGWRPEIPYGDGFAETFHWYASHRRQA